MLTIYPVLVINNLSSCSLEMISTFNNAPSPSSPAHNYAEEKPTPLTLPSHSCVVLSHSKNSSSHCISLVESISKEEVSLKDVLSNEINDIGNKCAAISTVIDFPSFKKSFIINLIRKAASREAPTLYMNVYDPVTLVNESAHSIKLMYSLNDNPLLSRELNIER
jgi:hypothetical protein